VRWVNAGDAGDDGAELVGEEFGERKVKKLQNPKEPTKEEREEHEKTHLPFRSWCRHCVRGRGVQLPHCEGRQETTTSEIHMDYGFLGKEDNAVKAVPMLVAKERGSKMLMAARVPTKTTGNYIQKRVVGFLREVGCLHGDLVVKSDQEPAIKTVVEDVGRAKAADGSGKYIVENSPVDASQSNGMVERGIRSVTAQTRVMLSAVQARWGLELPIEHPFICYLVEYAAVLLNRFEVGADGKTSYERNKGKKATTMGIEIGEAVLWRRKRIGGALGKLSLLWEDGIYLGIMGKSGEMIIGDGKGVWKTRSVSRKPIGERWDPATIDLVKHPPWSTSDDDPNRDGEMPDVTQMEMPVRERQEVEEEIVMPRRLYLKKGDFEKFGYTSRCPGCKAIIRGTRAVNHSDECRARMEKLLEGTDRMDEVKKKSEEFYSKVLEREDRKRCRVKQEGGEAEATEGEGGRSSSSGTSEETRKRALEEDKLQEEVKSRRVTIEEDDDGKRERDDDADDAEDQPKKKKKVTVGELEVNQEAEGEEGDDYFEDMIDEKTGTKLDPKLVKEAEDEEMSYMEDLGVGEEVPEGECEEMTGKPPVTTKWVRVNKGTEESPLVRARLVARDFKIKGDDRGSLFASMPPLEANKMLFRMAAKDRPTWRRGRLTRRKLFFIDVKKAHLNGKVQDDVYAYVRLPDGRVWRLKRWLYGMRPAAQAWEEDFAKRLEGIGFERGKSAPTTFFRRSTGCRCVVHGDDFTFLTYDDTGREIVKKMKEWYDLKLRAVIGDEDGDDKEVTILNRTLKHVGHGFEYYADERHEVEIRKEFGIGAESKGLESPVEKEDLQAGFDEEVDDPELDGMAGRRYRGVAARGNYLSLDRMDLQFAAKEACRQMAKPRASGQERMKRIARYLKRYPKVVWYFGRGGHGEDVIDVFSDSDWAACRRTRKSTSGGVATIDGGTIKHWSSTQGSVALSVGEAEYYALIKAAAEGLGMVALGRDLGYDFKLRIWVDSNTAKAITARLGLGKVRHMEVRYLWAQEAHKKGRFEVRKIAGERNPGDVLTKAMSAGDMKEKMSLVGARFADVRKPWCEERRPWVDIMDDESGG